MFYLLYLFPFAAHPPPEPPVYPQELKQEPIPYDPEIARWVKGTDFQSLADLKSSWFTSTQETKPVTWRSLMNQSKNIHRLWKRQDKELPKEQVYWRKMVVALHHHRFVNQSAVDVRAMTDDMKRLSGTCSTFLCAFISNSLLDSDAATVAHNCCSLARSLPSRSAILLYLS